MSLIPVSRAMHYVTEVHDYTAFVCEDGFCFVSAGVWGKEAAELRGYADDDRVEEDVEVFPIVDGMVNMSDLRAHMGY